jgi:hypothetical protein
VVGILRAQEVLEVGTLEPGVALVVAAGADVDDVLDPLAVELGVQLGPVRALHAVDRPRPTLGLERRMVRRVPVAGRDDDVEAPRQLVDRGRDVMATLDGERTPGAEVVLVVDDHQRV